MFLARPMTKGAENDADEKLTRFGQCWLAALVRGGSPDWVNEPGEATTSRKGTYLHGPVLEIATHHGTNERSPWKLP